MTAKDVILRNYAMAESITKAYLAELTAADLLVRPVPGQNHIAWQLGHLILTERKFLDGVKPGASPPLPPGFEEGHGRDKTNVDDPSKYLAPEDYLRLYRRPARGDEDRAQRAGRAPPSTHRAPSGCGRWPRPSAPGSR